MKSSTYFDPSYPLTPSEQFFIDVQDFKIGKKVSRWNNKWFPSWFGKSDLIPTLFIAAFLANEQTGSLSLDTYEKRILLGLGIRSEAVVSIKDVDVPWPQESLEFDLHRIGVLNREEGKNRVFDIVYEWLKPHGSPFALTFQSVMGHLCAREFLKKIDRKELGIIHVTDYFPREKLMQHAKEHGVMRIKKMLEDCRNSRSDLWGILLNEIKEAFTRRKDW